MQQKHHRRTFRFVAAAATVTFVGAMLAVSATPASASDLDISAKSDNVWDPTSLKSVVVGDVVTFKGLDEGTHDATGTIIPAAAAPIKSPPGAKDYEYSVTVAGVYNFLCSKHPGMNGSFTAAGKGGAAPAGAAAPAVAAGAAAAGAAAPAAGAAAAGAAAPAAGAAGVTHKVVTGPGNVFTPPTLAVKVGDSVSITGLGSHPTQSDVFPAGAAAIPMSMVDINYKVTVPGKYTYKCIAHPGMNGAFTATGAAVAGGPAAGTPAAGAPAAGAAPAGSQVTSIPVGGVQTGGGSTAAGVTNTGMLTLGFGLLMAVFMTTVASRRVARQK